MNTQPSSLVKSLTKQQKESLFLINIGTFLEYFDFKTYLHIAVVLNVIFFPSVDPFTKSMLAAFSFSMAYLLRPIGSLIFGMLGDIWGRKTNIIITTMTMSISSFFLGCMPTYAQAGIKASIGVIACRVIQGISSAVEIIGATVYITETFKAPRSYFYAGLVGLSAGLGELFALLCCSVLLILHPEDGWRYVFFLGSGIAVIGSIARTKLKETPEFLRASTQFKKSSHKKKDIMSAFLRHRRNALSYLLISLSTPFSFFVCFVYMGDLLIRMHGYTPNQVILNNFFITILDLMSYSMVLYLTCYFHPIKMMKIAAFSLLFFSLLVPYVIDLAMFWPFFIVQAFIACLNVSDVGSAIFARGFPVIGRYTILGTSYSLARAVGAISTSYACVIIDNKFGIKGVSFLMMTIVSLHLIGLYTFRPCKEDQDLQHTHDGKSEHAEAA